jgi:CRISPR/Cas system-associated protein Csx1
MVSLEWNVVFHILEKVKHNAKYSEVNTEFGLMSFHMDTKGPVLDFKIIALELW